MEYSWQCDLLLIVLCAISLPLGFRLGDLIWKIADRKKDKK